MSLICSNCQYKRPATTTVTGDSCPICGTPYSKEDLAGRSVQGDINKLSPAGHAALWIFLVAVSGGLYLLSSKYSRQAPAEVEQTAVTTEQKMDALDSQPWTDQFNPDLTRALALNKIQGCGDLRFKAMPGGSNEYVVACTNEQGERTGYLVWPNTNRVLGPIDLQGR